MSKTRYGTNGFYICATTDGDVLLTSEEDADNKGAEDLHLPADRLSDGYSGLLSFQGKTYYSCIRNMKMKEKNYLICLLPIETLLFSIFIVGLSTVAVVFISLLIMKYYVELMLLEPVNGRKLGEIAKSFRYRLLILTIACVCATAAVNIYFRSLYNYSSTTSLSTILSSYEGSDDTFSFVVDKDKKIVYSPYYDDEKVQTKDLGFADKIFEDNVTGFFKKADYLTLGCSRSVDKYQVIVGTFTDTIPLYGVRTGFIYALPGILAEILYFFFLMARINHPPDLKPEEKRFFFKNRKQEVALEESRLLNFLKYVCIAYAAFVTLIVFAGSVLFKEGTPGYYIFVYPWSGSFNIFTVTRCINYFCIVALGIFLLIKLLMLLATLLPSRQETVVRLILSFIRYATVIGALFFCMTLLGVPTASLLLSAGALTAIFSMGAQSTVADILAGLFIIFEDSFKVGDMITVDDWHGLAKDFAYLGVEEFADSAVILKFRVRCRNQDFVAVKRALRREVKLMFDRNNIQVPFPQLVLHKGTKEDGQ